jgi:hypothetical protein
MAATYRKFTPDEVLAVLVAADTPLTTSDVASKVRQAHGLTWDEVPRTGNADVTAALNQLVKSGRAVTAKLTSSWTARTKPGDPADAVHAHIVIGGNTADRFYATPEVSDKHAQRQADTVAEHKRAEAASDRLERAMSDLTSSTAGEASIRTTGPTQTFAVGRSGVDVHLNPAAAEKLARVINEWEAMRTVLGRSVLAHMPPPLADKVRARLVETEGDEGNVRHVFDAAEYVRRHGTETD